jgi:predicted DNA-binding transcriptional regulator AlpA
MMKQYLGAEAVADQLLDIRDLAKRLKIPVKTIRNKLCENTWPIRPLRIGRALRWRESDVDRTLNELAVASRDIPDDMPAADSLRPTKRS